jgi:diphthamide biosynthesis methyltransferase
MLYVVGLGLGDEKDITVNGLEAVKKCERVYLEAYTSILGVPKERLEALYGREVVVADREFVEQGIDGMLDEALKMNVAFLVRTRSSSPTSRARVRALRRCVRARLPPPPPAAAFPTRRSALRSPSS